MQESIFFLINLQTFTRAWHGWLGWGLEAQGFYVADIARDLATSYSALIKYLTKEYDNPHSHIGQVPSSEVEEGELSAPDEASYLFQLIIHRTLKLKESQRRVDYHLHQNDISSVSLVLSGLPALEHITERAAYT